MWIKKLRAHDLLSQTQAFAACGDEPEERWFGLVAVAAALVTFVVVWFITG